MKFYKRAEFYLILFSLVVFAIFLFYNLTITTAQIPYDRFFNTALLLVILAFFLNFIYMIFRNKNAEKYGKILKTFDYQKYENFNLKEYRFPANDDFGNLGERLNEFMDTIKEFDQLKKHRIKFYQQQIGYLLTLINEPIFITDMERHILSCNASFVDLFLTGEKAVPGQMQITDLFKGAEADKYFDELYERKPDDYPSMGMSVTVYGKKWTLLVFAKKVQYESFSEYVFYLPQPEKRDG